MYCCWSRRASQCRAILTTAAKSNVALGLQVTAGLRTTGYNIGADVNNDSVIGLPEVIYDLRILAVITTVTLAVPVMGTPTAASSSVSLSWTYPDSATASLVQGYNVYMTTTPNDANSWQQFSATGLSYQASNLQPDTTYYFAVAAYGEDSGGQTLNSQRSQQAQVKTLTGGTPGGDITNSLGMSFKSLPAGTFTMGSPSNPAEPERSSDETQHQVMLSSFYMQTTEVTQSQWKAVMGNTIAPHFIACGDNCPMESVSKVQL